MWVIYDCFQFFLSSDTLIYNKVYSSGPLNSIIETFYIPLWTIHVNAVRIYRNTHLKHFFIWGAFFNGQHSARWLANVTSWSLCLISGKTVLPKYSMLWTNAAVAFSCNISALLWLWREDFIQADVFPLSPTCTHYRTNMIITHSLHKVYAVNV